MGFFKKKKKLKAEITSRENLIVPSQRAAEEGSLSKKKIQHYIINCCEQIIEAKKELEEEKAEYRIV